LKQGLFGYYLHERNPHSLLRFIGIRKLNIGKALVLSIVFHFTIGLVFYLSTLFYPDLDFSNRKDESLLDVFSRINQKNPQPQDKSDGVLAQIIEYEDILKKITIQDSHLNNEELSQLTTDLIETLASLKKGHTSLDPPDLEIEEERIINEINELELTSGTKIFKAPLTPGKNQVKFYVLDKDKSEAFNSLPDKITATKEDYIYSGQRVRIELPEGGFKIVPDSYFFRESPFEQLLAQGADLFYVVTGFPNIYKKLEQPSKQGKSQRTLLNTDPVPKMLDVFLIDKFLQSPGEKGSDAEPAKIESNKATIDNRGVDQILDDLMVLPELKQLERFKKDFLDRQDLDNSSLIELAREFTRNNLSSIMFDISALTSAFDYLEEIYFNKALDHFFYKLWLRNPSSEIGADFLLCIVDHIRFEKNGLIFLHEAYTEANDFLSQKFNRTEMFNKEQKCFVIKDVYEDLTRRLPEFGYDSMDAVLEDYQKVEKSAYNLLLEMGGKAKNIGLYRLGRFAWKNEHYSEALEHWNNIDRSYSTKNLEKIRAVISRKQSLPQTILDIDSSLNWYVFREQLEFIDRLTKFGKWKNRSEKK